jgi:hypothetical protein
MQIELIGSVAIFARWYMFGASLTMVAVLYSTSFRFRCSAALPHG